MGYLKQQITQNSCEQHQAPTGPGLQSLRTRCQPPLRVVALHLPCQLGAFAVAGEAEFLRTVFEIE